MLYRQRNLMGSWEPVAALSGPRVSNEVKKLWSQVVIWSNEVHFLPMKANFLLSKVHFMPSKVFHWRTLVCCDSHLVCHLRP